MVFFSLSNKSVVLRCDNVVAAFDKNKWGDHFFILYGHFNWVFSIIIILEQILLIYQYLSNPLKTWQNRIPFKQAFKGHE